MSDRTSLETWLTDHGLGQHARKLLDSGIDLDVLGDLSDEDLRDLGFSLGDRKRFLKAVASHASESLRTAAVPSEGERRQITVLFCDLVGSTQLSRRLDPEDLRDVLRAYQQACVEAIQANDGYVARYEGDGLVAYFGYPKAYEDGPIRAVRASFAILGNLAAANPPLERTLGVKLDVRVGIHTGTVVVGEMGANSVPEHAAIVGDAPNLAARLQALAPANALVVSEDTRRLIAGVFPIRELGAQVLKGIEAPVDVYQVLPEGETLDRFEPRAARGLTPLVGREGELAFLRQHWRQARTGEMCAVLLSGEPGIGKSRTLRVFRDSLAGEPTEIIAINCSPYHQSSAFWPVIKSLERAIGRAPADTPVVALAKLDGFLQRFGLTDPQSGWMLATLLALPAHERYPQVELSAEELRQRTLGAIIALTGAIANATPSLLVLEDAQWSDASTLELVALMLERLTAARLLILVTARPGFMPRWGSTPHYSQLALDRLSRRESALLIDRVANGRSLPEAVRDQLVARSDGTPLFIEELTKAVLDVDASERSERAVPSSLQDSLMARLDRVEIGKEVAQVGAVIGREFRYGLVAAVAKVPEPRLTESLARLTRSGVLLQQGDPPEATYAFKHALLQDVAYASLLKGRRRELHEAVAREIERALPAVAENEPEVLARHYQEAALVEEAILHWERSGRKSLLGSNQADAAASFKNAVSLVVTLPEGPERDRRELALLLAYGDAQLGAWGLTRRELESVFLRARELAARTGDREAERRAQWGVCTCYTYGCRWEPLLQLGDELMASADAATVILANRVLGVGYLITGKLEAARDFLERGIAEARRISDSAGTTQGILREPKLVMGGYDAMVTWGLGYPARAQVLMQELKSLADTASDPSTRPSVLVQSGILAYLRRDRDVLLEETVAITKHAEDFGQRFWSMAAELLRGLLFVIDEDFDAALSVLPDAIRRYELFGTRFYEGLYRSALTYACAAAGRPKEFEREAAGALACIRDTGNRFIEPEVHVRLGLGLAHLVGHDDAAVEGRFGQSLEVARELKSPMWALRAATHLGRVWRRRGRAREARDLVAPIYERFTEGFDLPDLREARALLTAV